MNEKNLRMVENGVYKTISPDKFVIRGPIVILINPKFPHNVGAVLRICSCYGIKHLIYTGNRVNIDPEGGYRLPREERMRGYRDVTVYNYNRPLDLCYGTPIMVEVDDNTENLIDFEHPIRPVYIFGPEDGYVPKPYRVICHRFVSIPTVHCLNLSVAVGTVLYDQKSKHR